MWQPQPLLNYYEALDLVFGRKKTNLTQNIVYVDIDGAKVGLYE